MATFSLGGGVTPGAPGVYINESAGLSANADIASFSTVYMLTEAPEGAPVTVFPFNTPVPVTSINDYEVLVGGSVPTERIPLLSYNCVDEFFQNAQIGDLRVVRVGTPNQIVEIEILPSGTKLNSTSLPSQLAAGDKVYVQLILNGNRLVAGDGSTGYTSSGEWLGVPVIIPVDYTAGDEVNNRKISTAIVAAVAAAIESNPSIRSSVYVRSFGMVNDLDTTSNSQNGYINIAASTFDGSVTVITEQLPVGADYVLMQNAYNVQNIVGQQGNLVRVPQDYIQCIETAFDGQQDQGYLITPTAYAQFNTEGRTQVGAAAAAHCANNNFKWMALADPGPFLITDVNQYSQFTPHQAADDLVTDSQYLVDNAIYKWVGTDVNYSRLTYQAIVAGSSAVVAVAQSTNSVADGEKIGILDLAVYTASVTGTPALGKVELNSDNAWPVSYQIQEVDLSGASASGNPFEAYNGTSVFVIAPPLDIALYGNYSGNIVYLAETASEAVTVLNQVTLAGGTDNMVALPTGAISFSGSVGTASLTYTTPVWNFPQTINGQVSNLIQNTSGATAGVNTLHLPATLQDPTDTYRLSFKSRTIVNPSLSLTSVTFAGESLVLKINAVNHQLINGQKLYFTQKITKNSATLLAATTKAIAVPYYVTVIDANNFTLSESLSAYTAASYINVPSTGSFSTNPSIFYTSVLGGQQTSANLAELTVVPFVRARKYALNSGTIYGEAVNSTLNPTTGAAATQPTVSIFLNNSATALGEAQISPFGETTAAGWLPKLELITTGAISTTTANFYCTPTVDQSFAAQTHLVPSIDPINGGNYDAGVTAAAGALDSTTAYSVQCGLSVSDSGTDIQALISNLVGVYFNVTTAGVAPDGTTAVVIGDRIAVTYNGVSYAWLVVPASGDLTSTGQPLYGSQVELVFTSEQTPPTNLWRFDAITSTEIISNALRGVGTSGVPQAVFIEAGVDSVNRLSNDSQNYFNPFGFIAFYGPYVKNSASQWIPPSPYVTGVAVRRYRAEGYQFPPAGVKYQLADAMGAQIAINSSQQNLLNPEGCNVIRTLPNYPSSAVFIWGGRTRVNTADAQQRLYQFVNTRVILNVVYGSLRSAFDSQIFNVIDGFGIAFNQIISVGNSVLNQLYSRGALFGARPADAFQVICDGRINSPASLENGIINTKVFVTPVPTLERIQIDLIRVAIGQMQNELNAQGLGTNNTALG